MEKIFSWSFMLALAILVSKSLAQDTSCLNQLVPCLKYLNATTPPSSCCEPLKSVIKSDPKCLCDLLSSGSSGINMTEAMELPAKCGESATAASCTSGSTGTKTVVPNSANRGWTANVMAVAVLALIFQVFSPSNALF